MKNQIEKIKQVIMKKSDEESLREDLEYNQKNYRFSSVELERDDDYFELEVYIEDIYWGRNNTDDPTEIHISKVAMDCETKKPFLLTDKEIDKIQDEVFQKITGENEYDDQDE